MVKDQVTQVVEKRLPDHATVFQAEMQAIEDAINLVEHSMLQEIIIWSDRQASLKAITNDRITTKRC
uniref:RNase H type-1 domain-containing protein n=1 Tax=Scytodes thoracica TaxID=1112478 RepID=A0A0A0V6I0_SCYTH|nr:hypothetical protein [Scytodes thoracica]